MLKRRVISLLRRAAAIPARLNKRDFLAVFNYHQVSPVFESKYHLSTTWTSLAHFENELREIKSHFEILRLPEAIRQLNDGSLRGACAAITLDDGDISLERYVTPLLQRAKIPATYFVNSGYWGERRTYWVYLFPYLSHNEDPSKRAAINGEVMSLFTTLRNTDDPVRYRELREKVEAHVRLVDPGDKLFVSKTFLETLDPDLFSVGLHGHEHQRFSMMSEAWQRDSIEQNINHLSDLACYCPIFAVPFGRPRDWDETVIRIARQFNLDVVFANGGINVPGDSCDQRIPADGAKVMAVFRKNLVGW